MSYFKSIPFIFTTLFFDALAIPALAQDPKPGTLIPDLGWPVITIIAVVAIIGAGVWFLQTHAQATSDSIKFKKRERKIFAATQQILPPVIAAGGIGVLAVLLWAAGTTSTNLAFFKTAGALLLAACAAAGTGAVLGFLFGVPRTIEATRTAVAAQKDGDGDAVAAHASLVANTNLERVSDWLTTLLIGATLVQLGTLGQSLSKLGDLVSSDEQAKLSSAVAVMMMVYAFILGFLGTYLITRLYLTYAFRDTLGMLTGARREDDGENKKELSKTDATDSATGDATQTTAPTAQSAADKPLAELQNYEEEAQHI